MKTINILHLYPNEMNTYGDYGNVLTLSKRLIWHGYLPNIIYHHPGKAFPKYIDIVLGGGGQDSAQADVQADILKIGDDLRALAEQKVPMLMVCGTYQLLGHRYVTHDGVEVKGIGIFDAESIGGSKRMIGNVAVESDFGTLYGFENHSGRTKLASGQEALGKVLRGKGNNGHDKTEGAISGNVFGTYMHGPLLPNNPEFCDELIRLACMNKYSEFRPAEIDDSLAAQTRTASKNRSY